MLVFERRNTMLRRTTSGCAANGQNLTDHLFHYHLTGDGCVRQNWSIEHIILILVDCLNKHFAIYLITKISEIRRSEVMLTANSSDQNHNGRLKFKLVHAR